MKLTTFSVILAVLAAVGEASRQLIIIPDEESFTKALGGSMVFTCRVVTDDGSPAAGSRLRWLDDDNREIVDINGRRYVETGDDYKKLYIVAIQRSDEGSYKCRLDDQLQAAAVPLEKSITLIVFQRITYVRAPANQYLRRNAAGTIQCVVSGQPRPAVTWRFRGSRIITGGRYVVHEDGLEILNATNSDAGNYTCRAEVSEVGEYSERFISVAVNIPPVITRGPGGEHAVQGERFSVHCEATGTPPPFYVFYKGNELLESDNRVEINPTTGTVLFRTVNKADEASYTCTASNNVGNDSSTEFVRVRIKAAVLDFPNFTGMENKSAELRCRAIGDPAPNMTIRKIGQADPYRLGSSNEGRVVLRLVSRHILQLRISSLVVDDASNYRCSADNGVGRSQRTAVVTVNYGPRFPDDHIREVYTWAGISRNISCHPLAHPPATVNWTRSGRPVVDNGTYHIISTTSASYLQVYVRKEDQGWIYSTYTCRAQNEFGRNEININLRRASVPDAPKSVELTESMADGVILTVESPEEDGGMPVIGYRIHYGDDDRHDVTTSGSRIVVKDLQPNTTYRLRINAKNEVGFGNYVQLSVTTKSLSKVGATLTGNSACPATLRHRLSVEVLVIALISLMVGRAAYREYELCC